MWLKWFLPSPADSRGGAGLQSRDARPAGSRTCGAWGARRPIYIRTTAIPETRDAASSTKTTRSALLENEKSFNILAPLLSLSMRRSQASESCRGDGAGRWRRCDAGDAVAGEFRSASAACTPPICSQLILPAACEDCLSSARRAPVAQRSSARNAPWAMAIPTGSRRRRCSCGAPAPSCQASQAARRVRGVRRRVRPA